ncbi:hypothetical protein A3H09_00295 [Candidatus Falkowbacteria bacterium RIFCSPLOWO2_12_FULL_45_13]|uniref:Transposase IS4-like domain-containing protein n=1 Tax=Candidatus Falkowbacteria bacterium RIFCSPLOWO2_12_FULL_45_13 TaxID=1797991 RepID=A0A1F5SZJ5_9BACT|nr:MAG: hypothetical protein A3H09_00295 [Candidatus Falkowbacteria bacterium RIFCSPLOWO2_12_FULL_45_13]
MSAIKVWTHNPEKVEAAILAGEEQEEDLTKYGANEFAVDFLKQSGLWGPLLVKPDRGKENGKDWKKIAGIAILLELLHVGHLAKAEKVIKDTKLMVELGFTLEEVATARGRGKGVLHRDTVRNYFKAIPQEESIKEFYEYVNLLRRKRWNRGKVYVADGFELEVCGKTYEGVGKVYDDKAGKWKYGYKVVILMNVEKERERIMGVAIGPINSDERKLLAEIFEDLGKHVDKIKNIMDVIVLDRGYWGYDFMQETIVKKYGIDYVLIAKKSFMFVKEDLRHMIDSKQIKFQERRLYNPSKKEHEDVKVGYVNDLYHGYVSKAQPYQGMVNVVVLLKTIKEGKGKKQKEIFYVTNKRITGDPLKIVKLYASRWSVENQGIRDLSQRWLIRIPAGRTLNAVTARICLILKLYNAMKIMEMKHGQEWQKNKEEIKAWGERSFIGGQGIIVYANGYFATFSSRQYKILIETRTRRITEERLKASYLKNLERLLPKEQFEVVQQKLTC